MKIVFMGTPELAAGVLKALYEAGHEIVAAVTQPDKPKGRSKTPQMSPVKEFALEKGHRGLSAGPHPKARGGGKAEGL